MADARAERGERAGAADAGDAAPPHGAAGEPLGMTAAELAGVLHAELRGDADVRIDHLAGLNDAGPRDLTFIRDAKNASRWTSSAAGAALLSRAAADTNGEPLDPGDGRALLIVNDADLAMVEVLSLVESHDPHAAARPGVDPTAVVHPTAEIAESATVGPNAVVEAECIVGERSIIGPGVVVRRRCVVGRDVIIHPNAVIGADGFGYVHGPEGVAMKMPHVGRVVIDDHAEIGAGTCIDRGKFGDTTVGRHVKIDNLVQVGHNCRIGDSSIICGQTGLAGSVSLGRGVTLAAGVGIADNLTVGDRARLGARSGVMEHVPPDASWVGAPAMPGREFFRFVAAMKKLAKGAARRERDSG